MFANLFVHKRSGTHWELLFYVSEAN